LLYAEQIALGQRYGEQGEFANAAATLDDCRWDQRGWEWHHVRRAALLLHSLEGHTDLVLSVCFSPDGTRLASASRDGTLKVWDARSGLEALSSPLKKASRS